jgi:SAM-dependent methyltransferase
VELLTANDYARTCTCFSLEPVTRVLRDATAGGRVAALLDVGCGYGGVTATLASALGISEVHGVDIDPDVIGEACGKGVAALRADVAAGLPYPDVAFDLVTSFGMLDYLPWFDGALAEISRVLRPGGLAAIALPNLASWHNRLALLLGYQPRDIEFSATQAVGIAPYYRSAAPVGHLHAPTTRAFRAFMDVMGFEEVRTIGLRPDNDPPPPAVRALDRVLGSRPTTARRFLYVGRRTRDPVGSTSLSTSASR